MEGRPDFKVFITKVKSSELNERRNFLAALRVFYDSATEVFRACEIESCNSLRSLPVSQDPSQDCLKRKDFTALARILTNYNRIRENKFYFQFKFFAHIHVEPQLQRSRIDLPDNTTSWRHVVLLELPENADPNKSLPKMIVCINVNNYWLTLTRMQNASSSHYYLGQHEKWNDIPVTAYCYTDAGQAVQDLRDMRNTIVGHPPSTNLSHDCIQKLFKDVKKAYKKLAWLIPDNVYEALLKEFAEIIKEREAWSKENIERELTRLLEEDQRFYKDWVRSELTKAINAQDELSQRITELEKRDEANEKSRQEVVKLNEELARVTKTVEKLKQEKTRERDDDVDHLERKGFIYVLKQFFNRLVPTSVTQLSGDLLALGEASSSTNGEQPAFVPDALLNELADLRVAFAKLQCSYEEELRKSPEAQEAFVRFLSRLFHEAKNCSFQSHFDTLVEEKISLFNIHYLNDISSVLPEDIRLITSQLVKKYEQQRKKFMSGAAMSQFKQLLPIPDTTSKVRKGKLPVKLKLKNVWDGDTIIDLKQLIISFGVIHKHFHLLKVEDGCIAVIWLCSTIEVNLKHLKIAIINAADSLQTMGVLQVFIGEELVLECTHASDQLSRSARVVVDLKKLKGSFSSMITDLLVLFVSYKCDLSQARLFLGSFCRDDKAFGHCNTFKLLLEKLQNHMDSFNIEQLEGLVLYFNKKKMTKCIEKYKKERVAFWEKTTITDFQEAVVGIVDPAQLTHRMKFALKVSEDFACTQTLRDIEELAQKAIGIDYRFLVQMHAVKGSVISWIFPEALSQKLEALIRKNVEVFKDTGVLEVIIAGNVVYTSQEVPLDGDSTTSKFTRGGTDFHLLCIGYVKHYSFNLAKLASKKTTQDIEQELVKQLESTVKELERLSCKTVTQIYIESTYILYRRKQEFDPLNHHTWRKDAISICWSDHRQQDYGRDGMVVLCAITEDTVPGKKIHQERFTLDMEQYLIHHFRDDPRLASRRTYSRLRQSGKHDAYAIYMAFRYADDTTARKQEKTTIASVV